mmetsp:Transcript_21821/g.46082  ORF Transcript_21821/g.46082 Transcript_21821/m.46082 type:complete len:98 (+) Transcript_21821:521-814(+)
MLFDAQPRNVLECLADGPVSNIDMGKRTNPILHDLAARIDPINDILVMMVGCRSAQEKSYSGSANKNEPIVATDAETTKIDKPIGCDNSNSACFLFK